MWVGYPLPPGKGVLLDKKQLDWFCAAYPNDKSRGPRSNAAYRQSSLGETGEAPKPRIRSQVIPLLTGARREAYLASTSQQSCKFFGGVPVDPQGRGYPASLDIGLWWYLFSQVGVGGLQELFHFPSQVPAHF